MTEPTMWTVEVMVEVRDPEALLAAALASHDAEGGGGDTSHLLDDDAKPDVGACLQQLIDPGSLEGCKVIQSIANDAADDHPDGFLV